MITKTSKKLGASLKTLAACGVLLGMSSGMAQAVNLVTVSGAHVDFTYDSDATGLLGNPAVSGDIFYFTPTTFKSTSSGGAGLVTNTQNLSLTITPHAGYAFDSLGYMSNGDYSLYGAGINTVNVEGSLALSNGLDNSNSPISAGALTVISPTPLTTTNWTANNAIGLAGWGSNALTADLVSTLKASSGTLAFIEQKYVGFQVTVAATPVPEVETWTMMLAGVGLIALQLRRRTGSEARSIG